MIRTDKRTCPRCGIDKMYFTDDAMNPTSRKDTETYICVSCALDESIGGNTNNYKWAYPPETKEIDEGKNNKEEHKLR